MRIIFIRLQTYKFNINFNKGSLMYIANILSRAFMQDSHDAIDTLQLCNLSSNQVAEIEIQSTLEHLSISIKKLEEYVKETENYIVLPVTKIWVLTGWSVVTL